MAQFAWYHSTKALFVYHTLIVIYLTPSDSQVTGKIVTFYFNKQNAYYKLNIAINVRLHLVQISSVCFSAVWVATMNGWLIKNPTVNQNSSQKSKIPQKFLIHRNDNCLVVL